jgi:RNA polymerase sigma-70 factor (ECF subfamily)
MDATYGEARRIEARERLLVRGLLAGEESAFRELCDVYLPYVYRFARSRLKGDEELAKEMVQATAVKAISKLDGFRGDAALASWLCAICRNEIAGHFRKLGRAPVETGLETDELESLAAAAHGPFEGAERELLRRERAELVHVALDGLPAHYARALEWKYLDGLPVDEIASRLELGLKAAESLLTRARQAFRVGFSRIEQAGPPPESTPGAKVVLT